MSLIERADPAIIQGQLNVDYMVTALLEGTPSRRTLPGASIFTNVPVGNWAFQWTRMKNERMRPYEAKRAMRAATRTVDFGWETLEGKLSRYSLAASADTDELNNAHPSLALRQKKASFARMLVEMEMEREKRDLLVTATNYPASHRLAIGAGDEWNTINGDSRDNVRSMADAVGADTGIMLNELTVFLGYEAYQAAIEDPIFLASRSNYNADTPDLAALARFWGVARVWTARPVEFDTEGTTLSDMYGDIAILYPEPSIFNQSDWDTEYGDYVFAVNFAYNKGIAQQAWFDELHTTWYFPYHAYSSPKIVNNTVAAIITNCHD